MKADSGKSIPLVPGTSTPHKCPEKQETQTTTTTTAPPEKHETLASLEDIEKAELARGARNFDEEKIKTDIKLINEWARKTAHDFNWKTLDQTETIEDRRARNIAENVDKKQLFDMFFKLKYGKKNNSVDNVSR